MEETAAGLGRGRSQAVIQFILALINPTGNSEAERGLSELSWDGGEGLGGSVTGGPGEGNSFQARQYLECADSWRNKSFSPDGDLGGTLDYIIHY